MYDLNYIVPSTELLFNFIAESDTTYRAVDKLTGEVKGTITINGCTFEASSDDVFMQYKLWLTRPERAVGKKVDIDPANIDEMVDVYEELLVGAYILNSNMTVELIKPNIQIVLNWLRSTDFYAAPASTQYHEAFPGGLLIHSLRVYNQMVDLHKVEAFKSTSIVEATIGALVHDWCKIGFYESYLKNVKNEETGQWEKVTAYRHNLKGVALGHGATSMFLASRCFKLSVELAAAIRFHMGVWHCCDSEKNELQHCNAKYPLVYLIQFADQLAVTEYCTT